MNKSKNAWTVGLGPDLGAGRFGGFGLERAPPNCFTMQYRDGIPVGDGYLVLSAIEPNWINYVWGGRGPFKAGETAFRLATLEVPDRNAWTRRADWTSTTHIYTRAGKPWATIYRSLLSPAFVFDLHAREAAWSFDFGRCPTDYLTPASEQAKYASTGAYCPPVWGSKFDVTPEAVAPARGGSWPWILFSLAEARGMPWDMPMLWVFERQPTACRFDAEARRWSMRGDGPIGKVAVMPLLGARKLVGDECYRHMEKDSRETLGRCEAWARRLAAYPLNCVEKFRMSSDGRTVHIRNEYQHLFFARAGSKREVLAPVPPAVALAQQAGYPVKFEQPVRDLDCPTHYGPYQAAEGGRVEYSIPACAHIDRVLAPVRPAEESAEPAMKRLRECAQKPFFYFGGNMPQNPIDYYEPGFHAADLSILRMFAPGIWALPPKERDALLAQYSSGIAHYLPKNMRHEKEPTSGQTFYWGDLRAAAHTKNHSLFETDHEWYSGVFAAGLWAGHFYGAWDRAATRGHWAAAEGVARYWTIFGDWATSNVWCNLAGLFIFPDGANYSFCGAIAMARLARDLGKHAAAKRYSYMAARLQLATYTFWTGGPYMIRNRIGTVPRDYRDWMPLTQTAEFKGPRFMSENDAGVAFAGHLLSHGFPELLMFLRDYLPEKTRRYVYELFPAFGRKWPKYAWEVFKSFGHMVGHFYQLDSFLMARSLLFNDQLARRIPKRRQTLAAMAAVVIGSRPKALVPASARLVEHVFDDRKRQTILRLADLKRNDREIVFLWPQNPVSVKGALKWKREDAAVRVAVAGKDAELVIRWGKGK